MLFGLRTIRGHGCKENQHTANNLLVKQAPHVTPDLKRSVFSVHLQHPKYLTHSVTSNILYSDTQLLRVLAEQQHTITVLNPDVWSILSVPLVQASYSLPPNAIYFNTRLQSRTQLADASFYKYFRIYLLLSHAGSCVLCLQKRRG